MKWWQPQFQMVVDQNFAGIDYCGYTYLPSGWVKQEYGMDVLLHAMPYWVF